MRLKQSIRAKRKRYFYLEQFSITTMLNQNINYFNR